MPAQESRPVGDGDERDSARAKRKAEVHQRVLQALEPRELIKNRNNAKLIKEHHTRLKRMRDCGKYPGVVVSKRGKYDSARWARCKAALCPYCHDVKAAKHRGVFTPLVEALRNEGYKFTLITLTLPHSADDDLGQLTQWLFDSMRKFTRSTSFRYHVRGYVRGVEITNTNGNGFHPHVHFLVAAIFWPLEDLIEIWRKAVRKVCGRVVADNGVDVKGIKDVETGLAEAAGYPVKQADFSTLTDHEIRVLYDATFNRHLVQSSRDWGRRARRMEGERKEARAFADEFNGIASVGYANLIRRVKRGDVDAQKLAMDLLWRLLEEGDSPAACGVIGINLARYGARWIRDQLPEIYKRGA